MPDPNPKFTLPIPTRLGNFLAQYSAAGLCRLSFPETAGKRSAAQKRSGIPRFVRGWHATTSRAVASALSGKEPLGLPPLDLAGTEFQQQVWRALRRIRPARTKSYSEVAGALGKPGAARAVGGACGANPIPLLIPCHRVLAADGKIGGFSGGLNWKRSLLEIEGVRVVK